MLLNTMYKMLIGYKEIEVNSNTGNVEKAFVDFIIKCNWRKKYIELQVLCSNKCCSFPKIFTLKVTENKDLDDIFQSIKNNNFSSFMKKNIVNEKVLDNMDFNSFINRKVNYIMYPQSNQIIMSFY